MGYDSDSDSDSDESNPGTKSVGALGGKRRRDSDSDRDIKMSATREAEGKRMKGLSSPARPRPTPKALSPLMPYQMTAEGKATAARVEAALRAEQGQQQSPSGKPNSTASHEMAAIQAKTSTAAAIAAARARKAAKARASSSSTSSSTAAAAPSSSLSGGGGGLTTEAEDFFNITTPSSPAPPTHHYAVAMDTAPPAYTRRREEEEEEGGIQFTEVRQSDLVLDAGMETQREILREAEAEMARMNATAKGFSATAKSRNQISHLAVQAQMQKLKAIQARAREALRSGRGG